MKFTYNDVSNCLILKNSQGELIDHKFYNNYAVENMSINGWLKMINSDIEVMANKNNIDTYIINLLN